MTPKNIEDCVRGWFIGDFEPSILRTKEFEVAFMKWQPGPFPDMHYQRVATEYNLLVRGRVRFNGKVYNPGDFFIIEPYMVNEGEFLQYSECVVVKTPSIPDDKVEVSKPKTPWPGPGV